MNVSQRQLRTLYRQYEGGKSLADIGEQLGVSHETVRQLFIANELPIISLAERGARAQAEFAEQAAKYRDRVVQLYKSHGTIDAVAEQIPLPRQMISQMVSEIPNRESYRRRGNRSLRAPEEIVPDLQRAAKAKGEPLTTTAYAQAARELGLAAYMTVIRSFRAVDAKHPWAAALKAAGVQGNEPRGRYKTSYTPEECVSAVSECLLAHGSERVSYDVYCEWAPGRELPSGPTVRSLVGWNQAVDDAFELMAKP